MSILLNDERILNEYLKDFYSCFTTGYDFEVFLKHYLLKIGLDEVRVTQKSKDGGIDLVGIRYGISNFSDLDSVEYIVQAKRREPSSKIPSKDIDALRGVMHDGNKGLFIATCDYSKEAIDKAEDKAQIGRPIILISGIQLIKSCADNEIGFNYMPIINKEDVIAMATDKVANEPKKIVNIDDEIKLKIVNKKITNNDIKARILRLPREIKEKMDLDNKNVRVKVNDDKVYDLTLDASNTYLAKVTEIYRKYNLIKDDGSMNNQTVKMFIDNGMLNLIFDE